MKQLTALVALVALVSTLPAWASGNAAAGKTKSLVCAACHGADGNSVNPAWPKLAGQGAPYLVKQLEDFKAGRRKNPLMSPMAAHLSHQDMENLAAYFSEQKRAPANTPRADVKPGAQIYRGGDAATGVPACMACHGPAGNGNLLARYPSLWGQHAKYVLAQLQAFAAGTRSNDPNHMMRDIAKAMSPAQMKAVSEYVQGLH